MNIVQDKVDMRQNTLWVFDVINKQNDFWLKYEIPFDEYMKYRTLILDLSSNLVF